MAYALSGADLLQVLPPVPEGQISMPSKWTTVIQHKFLNPQQPVLAHDKVRHVGEAIGVIVAESRNQAEDAAEQVMFDLEELPAVVGAEAALRSGSPIVTSICTNLFGAFSVGQRRLSMRRWPRAPHRLRRRFYHHRYAAVPMECRGVVAAYDPADRSDDDLVVDPGRALGAPGSRVAPRLPEARVRCVALDVGGGFGVKGHVYPEDLLSRFWRDGSGGRCAGSRTGAST